MARRTASPSPDWDEILFPDPSPIFYFHNHVEEAYAHLDSGGFRCDFSLTFEFSHLFCRVKFPSASAFVRELGPAWTYAAWKHVMMMSLRSIKWIWLHTATSIDGSFKVMMVVVVELLVAEFWRVLGRDYRGRRSAAVLSADN